ncbi:hypothetical protein CPB97_007750 [Podila verticillata]|nr:hypothetical protein CPB97_007750 [Podila verticillata]
MRNRPTVMELVHSMMRDVTTLDFAFVFKHPESGHMVALWTHQSVLNKTSDRFKQLHHFPKPDGSRTAWLYSFHSDQVPEYSLVAYCTMVRYIYTGKVHLHNDMREFLISDLPIQSPVQSQYPEDSGVVKELRAAPLREACRKEVFKLAGRYGLEALRAYLITYQNTA